MTGCGDRHPPSTLPGTYTFNISARGAAAGLVQNIPISLNVSCVKSDGIPASFQDANNTK